MRTRLGLALTAATLVAAPLAAIVPAHATTAPATQVITSRPWQANGVLRVHAVVRSGHGGTCNDSNVSGRTDAYRCYVGNQIIDPAFKSPRTHDVVALEGNRWVEYKGISTFHRQAGATSNHIWRVRLANGAVCTAATGAGPAPVAKYPYWMGFCSGGPYAASQMAVWRTPANGAAIIAGNAAHTRFQAAVEYPLGSGHVTLVPVLTALR